MDAAEWDTSINPMVMLAGVRDQVSERKFRLFALACCRRRDDLLLDWRCQEARSLVERMVEEKARAKELEVMRLELELAEREIARCSSQPGVTQFDYLKALLVMSDDTLPPFRVAQRVNEQLGRGRSSLRAHVALLREVMGNPFRPTVIERHWLEWERGLIRELALIAYDGRAYDRLPIIADALEDVGCTSVSLLDHLRGGGPHVLGCWALDLLLSHHRTRDR